MCQYYFETVKIKRLTNKIPSNKTMNNTSAIVWNNCLSFIEDNITQQACWVILSSINERQLFHTIAEVLFIVLLEGILLVNLFILTVSK